MPICTAACKTDKNHLGTRLPHYTHELSARIIFVKTVYRAAPGPIWCSGLLLLQTLAGLLNKLVTLRYRLDLPFFPLAFFCNLECFSIHVILRTALGMLLRHMCCGCLGT